MDKRVESEAFILSFHCMLSMYIRVAMQEPCNSEARAMLLDMWDPKVSRVCRAPVVTVAAAASNYCILV